MDCSCSRTCQFEDAPEVLFEEPIFAKALKIAEVSNLNKEEMNAYEASLKEKRDWHSAMDTAIQEALEKGKEEWMEKGIEKGIERTARQMKKEGFSNETIAKITGLSIEEINRL
jgi:predicted transposase/invertase (TIGR01784 family)